MSKYEFNGQSGDVYPVGWLEAWKVRRLKREWLFVVHMARRRNWRAIRNTFNGYLAEHDHGGHNCGKGWTKRTAIRRAEAICKRATEERS